MAAIGFPTRRGYNVADDHSSERVAATKDAMRMASEFGGSVVVNQVGRVPASTEAADWPIMLEALHRSRRASGIASGPPNGRNGKRERRGSGAADRRSARWGAGSDLQPGQS